MDKIMKVLGSIGFVMVACGGCALDGNNGYAAYTMLIIGAVFLTFAGLIYDRNRRF